METDDFRKTPSFFIQPEETRQAGIDDKFFCYLKNQIADSNCFRKRMSFSKK